MRGITNLFLISTLYRYYDTAGQEDFETLRKLAYRGCDILVIVFSIVNKDSFDNVRAKWNQDRKAHMSKAKVSQLMDS